MTDLYLSNIKLYFDVGIANGADLLAAALKLEAKLILFSVQTGSQGGSLIIANKLLKKILELSQEKLFMVLLKTMIKKQTTSFWNRHSRKAEVAHAIKQMVN